MKVHRYLFLSVLLIASLMLCGAAASQSLFLDDPLPEKELDRRSSSTSTLKETERMDKPFAGTLIEKMLKPQPSANSTVELGAPGFAFRIHDIFGVSRLDYPEPEPYPVDTGYLNGPAGIFIDNSNNLYVAESRGSRVLRYNSSGGNTLSMGTAGWFDVWDDNFDWPQDVVVDSTGDIWVVDASRVSRYSSTGENEMNFPADLDEAYDCSDDNDHFCWPQGVAMDLAGRLYVSDTENHRIQVFTISGGTPVYSTTIGTGIAGTGSNQFNYPAHIAIDNSNQLFIADGDNYRVQKCTYGLTWTCSTFHGVSGVWGDDANHLGFVIGIAVDLSGNVFIADEDNWRVKKCTSAGICADIITDVNDPTDVALDLLGNIYVSSWYNSFTINKYNSSGDFSGYFAGTFERAYIADNTHIYAPHGIGVDPSGNIYVSERMGNRWLKLDKDGNRIWSKGTPGMRLNNPDYFGNNLYGNPAVSADNLLYLPSGSSRCVRIYDLDGVYQNATLGTCHGTYPGDSGSLYDNVGGVAISPVDGRIYVVDRGNNKVKVYDSARTFLNVLGQGLGSVGYGNGNYQFDNPMGIAVDKSGNVYVADRNNHRVQKYSNSGVFQYSIGVTDTPDWQYGYLGAPTGVAVDRDNQVYIAENWNNRVTIYDSAGAYLTTIGGRWGTWQGGLNRPAGVAIAADGTVYVTEENNHRVQVFKPGVPNWGSVNLNGFGDANNGNTLSLEPFGSELYAGLYNDFGAQIWRLDPASGWEMVTDDGFGSDHNFGIDDLIEFDGNIYAGTWSDEVAGAEIWRSDTGDQGDWDPVVQSGNGDTDNGEVMTMVELNGSLYVGTWRYDLDTGAEVWRSTSGNDGTWDHVVVDGLTSSYNYGIVASEVYSDHLYLSTGSYDNVADTPVGAEVWRTATGNNGEWSQVNVDGFRLEHQLLYYRFGCVQG